MTRDPIDEVKDEIKELRRWRHDLEGMGIQSVPAKVDELYAAKHRNDLNDAEDKHMMDNLTGSVNALESSIQEIRQDFKALKKGAILAIVGVITAQVLPPDILVTISKFLVTIF
jgi:hypothetical protein